jgi:hypothetical protein
MTILGLVGCNLLNDNEGKHKGDDTAQNFFNAPVLHANRCTNFDLRVCGAPWFCVMNTLTWLFAARSDEILSVKDFVSGDTSSVD